MREEGRGCGELAICYLTVQSRRVSVLGINKIILPGLVLPYLVVKFWQVIEWGCYTLPLELRYGSLLGVCYARVKLTPKSVHSV